MHDRQSVKINGIDIPLYDVWCLWWKFVAIHIVISALGAGAFIFWAFIVVPALH